MIRPTSTGWLGMRRWTCLLSMSSGGGGRFTCGTQNLLNQPFQAGKTPILTLGAPVTVLGGVRFSRRRLPSYPKVCKVFIAG